MGKFTDLSCAKCGTHGSLRGVGGGRVRCTACGKSLYIAEAEQFTAEAGIERDVSLEVKASELAEKQATIDELRRANRELQQEASIETRLRSFIHDLGDGQDAVPGWVKGPNKAKQRGTPTIFLSDLHWGETVFSKQVNGVNHYDLPTARARLKRTIESSLGLFFDELSRPDYPGVVVPLGGDMCSGNIHEELRETNDAPLLECVADCEENVAQAITTCANEFKRVFVPCVVGNHGRLDKKPRGKNGVVDNVEWLIYEMLRKRFATDDRVTIIVPTSFDCLYSIHGHRYLLTHGDQFKGGNGITGPLLPWKRGEQKKKAVYSAVRQDFDVLIMGHWHQAAMLPGEIIVNGSLKGYDEYAFRMGFEFQKPQQTVWITDPKHGIWYWQPVDCDERAEPPAREWVSVAA